MVRPVPLLPRLILLATGLAGADPARATDGLPYAVVELGRWGPMRSRGDSRPTRRGETGLHPDPPATSLRYVCALSPARTSPQNLRSG